MARQRERAWPPTCVVRQRLLQSHHSAIVAVDLCSKQARAHSAGRVGDAAIQAHRPLGGASPCHVALVITAPASAATIRRVWLLSGVRRRLQPTQCCSPCSARPAPSPHLLSIQAKHREAVLPLLAPQAAAHLQRVAAAGSREGSRLTISLQKNPDMQMVQPRARSNPPTPREADGLCRPVLAQSCESRPNLTGSCGAAPRCRVTATTSAPCIIDGERVVHGRQLLHGKQAAEPLLCGKVGGRRRRRRRDCGSEWRAAAGAVPTLASRDRRAPPCWGARGGGRGGTTPRGPKLPRSPGGWLAAQESKGELHAALITHRLAERRGACARQPTGRRVVVASSPDMSCAR